MSLKKTYEYFCCGKYWISLKDKVTCFVCGSDLIQKEYDARLYNFECCGKRWKNPKYSCNCQDCNEVVKHIESKRFICECKHVWYRNKFKENFDTCKKCEKKVKFQRYYPIIHKRHVKILEKHIFDEDNVKNEHLSNERNYAYYCCKKFWLSYNNFATCKFCEAELVHKTHFIKLYQFSCCEKTWKKPKYTCLCHICDKDVQPIKSKLFVCICGAMWEKTNFNSEHDTCKNCETEVKYEDIYPIFYVREWKMLIKRVFYDDK
jgi:hypothetical protein